ncbi:hypothetical protein [Psychromicrobium sp. YIM B11713]|uniref:hypothetical protein n=1 Tax=Psychromicrobium sp. YIM B11713 TaxID=3145233 RepID=UPI00374F8EA4
MSRLKISVWAGMVVFAVFLAGCTNLPSIQEQAKNKLQNRASMIFDMVADELLAPVPLTADQLKNYGKNSQIFYNSSVDNRGNAIIFAFIDADAESGGGFWYESWKAKSCLKINYILMQHSREVNMESVSCPSGGLQGMKADEEVVIPKMVRLLSESSSSS